MLIDFEHGVPRGFFTFLVDHPILCFNIKFDHGRTVKNVLGMKILNECENF